MVKNKTKWKRITNEYVVSQFKVHEHDNCNGTGLVGEEASGYKVCSCATLAFRREADSMLSQGKLRLRKQRMGNRDIEWFEYREIGSLAQ